MRASVCVRARAAILNPKHVSEAERDARIQPEIPAVFSVALLETVLLQILPWLTISLDDRHSQERERERHRQRVRQREIEIEREIATDRQADTDRRNDRNIIACDSRPTAAVWGTLGRTVTPLMA